MGVLTALPTIVVICTTLLFAVSPCNAGDVSSTLPLESSCSAQGGCPRSSMVWASGTFTDPGLLTPAALTNSKFGRLELRLSLCCRYLFHGAMLHDMDKYDAFLETLLYATPFRLLSISAKRTLFPVEHARLLHSSTGSIFSASSQLPSGEDGDGDVLHLTIGVLSPDVLNEAVTFTLNGGRRFDVQLQVSNHVLKCKCPHTLNVLPLLSFAPDELPVGNVVVGAGHVCIDMQKPLQDRRVVFTIAQPVAPFTDVTWKLFRRPVIPSDAEERHRPQSVSAGDLRGAYLVSEYSISIQITADAAAAAASSRLVPFDVTDVVEPHVRYEVIVVLKKGAAVDTLTASFVSRIRPKKSSSGTATATFPMEPFFGWKRPTTLRSSFSSDDETVLLNSPHYARQWRIAGSGTSAATPVELAVAAASSVSELGSVTIDLQTLGIAPVESPRFNISFVVTDVDHVCPEYVVEMQQVQVIQPSLLHPSSSPFTLCTDDATMMPNTLSVPVLFNPLHLRAMASHWACTAFVRDERGHWRAADHQRAGSAPDAACPVATTTSQPLMFASRTVVLKPAEAAVVQFGITFSLSIADLCRLRDVTCDGATNSVVTALQPWIDDSLVSLIHHENGVATIRVLSTPTVLFRRSTTPPDAVHVTIQTRDETLQVKPPHRLLVGTWATGPQSPIRLTTPRHQLTATLDLSAVPNTPTQLPNSSLVFHVQDAGEMVTMEGMLAHGSSFHAKCPDATLVYMIRVVAVPPEPIADDLATVRTEASSLFLTAPRAAAKDEIVAWEALECPDAPNPLELVTPGIHVGEPSVIRVLGITPHSHCEVIWSVRNAVGRVFKRFSIRRCEVPPALRFRGMNLVSHQFTLNSQFLKPPTVGDEHHNHVIWIPLASENATLRLTTWLDRESAKSRFQTNFQVMSLTMISSGFLTPHASFGLHATSLSTVASFVEESTHETASDALPSMSFGSSASYRQLLADGVIVGVVNDAEDAASQVKATTSQQSVDDTVVTLHYTKSGSLRHPFSDITAQRRDRAELDLLQRGASITHIRFQTRACPDGMNEPAASELAAFFEERLCTPVQGHFRALVLEPSALLPFVLVEQRQTAAISSISNLPVVEMCSDSLNVTKDAWWFNAVGYYWNFTCESGSVQIVTESPTSHQINIAASTFQETVCALVLRNQMSGTDATQPFILRRVAPHAPEFNANTSIASLNEVEAVLLTTATPAVSSQRRGRQLQSVNPPEPQGELPKDIMRFVGSSVVLQVGHPAALPDLAAAGPLADKHQRWSATSFVPTCSSSSKSAACQRAFQGSALTLSNISFHEGPSLNQLAPYVPQGLVNASTHAQRSDFSSNDFFVVIRGFTEPGVYTVQFQQKDPLHPTSCPLVSLQRTLRVYRAQVQNPEIVVCGSRVVLQAVPVPRELEHTVYGQWEVVSRKISDNPDNGTLTKGSDFAGIRFAHGHLPRTIVDGLSFGVTTVRWALYKNIVADRSNSTNKTTADSSSRVVEGRILVDEAIVVIKVLTENLATNRLVTLSDKVQFPVSSSTFNWRFDPVMQQLAAAQQAMFFTTKALTFAPIDNTTMTWEVSMQQLRYGVTGLLYDVRPSLLQGTITDLRDSVCPTTPPTERFEVERVAAFLSLRNVSVGDSHECDAYTGRIQVSLCLEAGDVSTAAFFHERVRLVPAEEAVAILREDVKLRLSPIESAYTTQRSATQQSCRIPWWLEESSADVSAVSFEDDRCLALTIRARRHLHFHEAASPLLHAAAPLPASSRADNPLRTAALAVLDNDVSSLCSASGGGPDVFSSRIIRGAWGDAATYRRSGGGEGSLRRHLSILDPKTLKPLSPTVVPTLQPLVGYTLAEDVTVHETDVSAGDATVVIQLERPSAAVRVASFTLSPKPLNWSEALNGDSELLVKCVSQQLRGADVLDIWSSVEGHSAEWFHSWTEYTDDVKLKMLPCEPMFDSLEAYLPREKDTLEALRQRRAEQRFIPVQARKLVTLLQLERQLAALKHYQYWTADGIEISGLHPELQHALHRKRLTESQLQQLTEERRKANSLNRQQSKSDVVSHGTKKQEDESSLATFDDTTAANFNAALVMLNSSEYRSRLSAALEAYYNWTQGSGISAMRLRLPPSERFVMPRRSALRMAISKNVVCGLKSSALLPAASSSVQHSVVWFQRMYVQDDVPVVTVKPESIKQCDVEAEIPPFEIQMTGTRLAPHVVRRLTESGDHNAPFPSDFLHSIVDVTELVNEDIASAASTSFWSSKHPTAQDAVVISKRSGATFQYATASVGLQPCIPMLLSGLKGTADGTSLKSLQLRLSPCAAFQMISNEEYNEHQDSDQLLHRLMHPRLLRVTLKGILARDSHGVSPDVSFTVRVMPTAVRTSIVVPSPPLHHSSFSESPSSSHVPLDNTGRSTNPRRRVSPAIVCETSLKRRGVDIKLDLVGDTWHPEVGSVPRCDSRSDDGCQRSPQDVALLNSFSHIERYRMDSTAYSFLADGGGLYRSHFVHYLFTSVLHDDTSHRLAPVSIRRYNDTILSIHIPPASRATLEDPNAQQLRALVVPGKTEEEYSLPVTVPFTSIEEILLAVPGIATQCKGCLLADTTFFVAGDWSGVWSTSSTSATEGRPSLTSPVVVPMHDSAVIPRIWTYAWLCTTNAAQAIEALLRRLGLPLKSIQPYLKLDMYVLQQRDVLLQPLPPQKRAISVLTSRPLFVNDMFFNSQHNEHTFQIDEGCISNSRVISDDVQRRLIAMHQRVSGSSSPLSTFDYVRAADGRLALNATVVLKLCVGGTNQPLDPCTILQHHPALVVVEAHVGAADGMPLLQRIGPLWHSLTHKPSLLLHHLVTTLVAYEAQDPTATNVLSERNAMAWRSVLIVLPFTIVTAAYWEAAWVVAWLAVWAILFAKLNDVSVGMLVLFALHGALYAFSVLI